MIVVETLPAGENVIETLNFYVETFVMVKILSDVMCTVDNNNYHTVVEYNHYLY